MVTNRSESRFEQQRDRVLKAAAHCFNQKGYSGTSLKNVADMLGLTDAAIAIGDTDFAMATADLNRQQVLMQSGIALLGIANQQAAQILSLL